MATLLRALADVYATEGRPGGDAAAEAYARAAETLPETLPQTQPYRLDAEIRAAARRARHPAAAAARAAHPWLHWKATGVQDSKISPEVAEVFAVVPLLGPVGPRGAMFEAEGVRAGLLVQRANTYYPLHAHEAEETYVMLAGEGIWRRGAERPARRRPGDVIFHPSKIPHATRTGARPLLAAWRWSGDIGLESYRLVPDNALQESSE